MSDEVVATKTLVLANSTTPDVCLMPNGTITCFDLIAFGPDVEKESLNVRSRRHCVMTTESEFLQSFGDEPATGGMCSGTIRGKVQMLPNSCNVKNGGKQVMRKGDECLMNNGNAFGVLDMVKIPGTVIGSIGKKYDDATKAEEDAKKSKRQRGKNRRKGRNKTRNRRRKAKWKQRDAAYRGKSANAAKLRMPGQDSALMKGVTKGAKGAGLIGDGVEVVQIGGKIYSGDYAGAGRQATGVASGKVVGGGVLLGCGAAGIAGGWPGLLCLLGAMGADAGTSYVVEKSLEPPPCPTGP